MKFIIVLLLGVLGTPLLDRQRRWQIAHKRASEILTFSELESRTKRVKKVKRTYHNKKWKSKKLYFHAPLKLKGTQAKDRRYSNQRTLRRLFRNS